MNLLKYNEINLNERLQRWDDWWDGKLGRPMFQATVMHPCRAVGWGFVPSLLKGFNQDKKAFTEAVKNDFDNNIYYAPDSIPQYWPNFGAGSLAPMVGGEAKVAPESIWFEQGKWKDIPLDQISLRFNPEDEYLRQICEIYALLTEKLAGKIVFGHPDQGGVMDVLSSIRGAEQLLVDLYDDPDSVHRLVKEEVDAWIGAYQYIRKQFDHASPGSGCWAGFFSAKKAYVVQSDFSYMISPDMFKEFVVPGLTRVCQFLDRSIYHLDGIPQIQHLPHLFKVPNLYGIQWIPGAGNPEPGEWLEEVYAPINEANVKVQLMACSLKSMRKVLKYMKHPENAVILCSCMDTDTEILSEMEKLMIDYGAI